MRGASPGVAKRIWSPAGSLFGRDLAEIADVGEMAADRGRRGHGRAHQMGAPAAALAAFEIAVRGRGTTLAGLELVGVHRQAHGTAGLAPFETSLEEDPVEAFLLGLVLHQA